MADARITLDAAALKARIATLEAELAEAQRDATFGAPLIVESYKAELLQRDVTINALRDALEDVLNNATCACYEDGEPGHCPRCAVAYQEARTALAQTPAASLAAAKDSLRSHDAEVLERAAKACGAPDEDPSEDNPCSGNEGDTFDWAVQCASYWNAKAIRALAAQEVTK